MQKVQSHKVKLVGVDGQEQAVILDIETEGVHLLSQKAQVSLRHASAEHCISASGHRL